MSEKSEKKLIINQNKNNSKKNIAVKLMEYIKRKRTAALVQ